MRIIRSGDTRPVAWKNGAGITSDILMQPEGSTRADFLWRLSFAEGRECAPFSAYPGVDRTLVVMDGARLMLDFGGGTVMLNADSRPLCYPGEAPVIGWLDAGPVRILNVMTRRGAARHHAVILPVDGHMTLPVPCRALVCRAGLVTVAGVDLHPCDSALLPEGGAAPMVSGAGEVVAVDITVTDPPPAANDDDPPARPRPRA